MGMRRGTKKGEKEKGKGKEEGEEEGDDGEEDLRKMIFFARFRCLFLHVFSVF